MAHRHSPAYMKNKSRSFLSKLFGSTDNGREERSPTSGATKRYRRKRKTRNRRQSLARKVNREA